jgi:hypothetical protein
MDIYIYHDKDIDQYIPFTALTTLSDATGMNIETLSYQFTRKKRASYEKNGIKIIKTELIRAERITT